MGYECPCRGTELATEKIGYGCPRRGVVLVTGVGFECSLRGSTLSYTIGSYLAMENYAMSLF